MFLPKLLIFFIAFSRVLDIFFMKIKPENIKNTHDLYWYSTAFQYVICERNNMIFNKQKLAKLVLSYHKVSQSIDLWYN